MGTKQYYGSVTSPSEVESQGSGASSAALEARVVRKLDMHIMPIFFVLYMLAFLDRSNIGNARIAGMSDDLHLDGDKYDWLLTMFYASYILFEPTLLLWKMLPPHKICAGVVFLWGVMATLQAAVNSWAGVMALRFFLGIFEAAYGPGVIFLLSFFYLRGEVGFRCGMFVSAAPLASTFAGALAYAITSGHSKLASWRLLFLVEGLPTILMAPIAYFFIPDSPDKSKFLNAEEQALVRARAVRQAGTTERTGSLNFKETLQPLLDFKAWFVAMMYFSANVSYASLPVFMPTMLHDMGYDSINAQGLSAPPYFAAFLLALAMAWLGDRSQQKGYVIAATSIVGGTGYILLATVESTAVRYFAVYLAAAGVFSTIPNLFAWNLNNQGSDTRRGAGLVLINLVGQCGPVLGTRLYPLTQKPRYVPGMSICAAFMFFSALLALSLRMLLVRENRKLDREYEASSSEGVTSKDDVGVENYGPSFRYVL